MKACIIILSFAFVGYSRIPFISAEGPTRYSAGKQFAVTNAMKLKNTVIPTDYLFRYSAKDGSIGEYKLRDGVHKAPKNCNQQYSTMAGREIISTMNSQTKLRIQNQKHAIIAKTSVVNNRVDGNKFINSPAMRLSTTAEVLENNIPQTEYLERNRLYNNHYIKVTSQPSVYSKPSMRLEFNPIVVREFGSSSMPTIHATSTINETPDSLSNTDELLQSRPTTEEISTESFKKSVRVGYINRSDLKMDETSKSNTVHASNTSNISISNFNLSSFNDDNNNNNNNSRSISYDNSFMQSRSDYSSQSNLPDIPSSILDILNQNKEQSQQFQSTVFPDVESKSNPTSTMDMISPDSKDQLPKRPMRLIGLTPNSMDGYQLQNLPQEFLTMPKLQLDVLSNMQYATPTPIQSGPLYNGISTLPFRNVPRSVEPSITSSSSEIPIINAIPIINPAYFFPQQPPQVVLPPVDVNKSEMKSVEKTLNGNSHSRVNFTSHPPANKHSVPSAPQGQGTVTAAITTSKVTNTGLPYPKPACEYRAAPNTNFAHVPVQQTPSPWPYSPNIAYILVPTSLMGGGGQKK